MPIRLGRRTYYTGDPPVAAGEIDLQIGGTYEMYDVHGVYEGSGTWDDAPNLPPPPRWILEPDTPPSIGGQIHEDADPDGMHTMVVPGTGASGYMAETPGE